MNQSIDKRMMTMQKWNTLYNQTLQDLNIHHPFPYFHDDKRGLLARIERCFNLYHEIFLHYVWYGGTIYLDDLVEMMDAYIYQTMEWA